MADMQEAMKIASAYASTIQRERIKGRRVVTTLQFNGHDISEKLQPYLIGVTFTDVAAGSSDSISIDLYDADMQWIKDWYPTKGDVITGGAIFKDWNYVGERLKLTYGRFILDSIKFSGGPLRCTFGGLAIPHDRSFKTRQRTKTWEGVTLSQIGKEIAGRYGLTCVYNAGDINIESLEQTDKTDSDFLASTVKDYGLKMKVYNKKIVIFDAGRLEAKSPVCTITRKDFIGDGWSYDDELEGTYTGAIIAYKSDKSSKDEIKLSVGNADESSPKSRVLYINSKCDSHAEADTKARQKVNEANETMTKLSGTIWTHQVLTSGQTVQVKGMGKASGKYYIDKITTSISDGGTKQKVDMHKCYKRL